MQFENKIIPKYRFNVHQGSTCLAFSLDFLNFYSSFEIFALEITELESDVSYSQEIESHIHKNAYTHNKSAQKGMICNNEWHECIDNDFRRILVQKSPNSELK